MNLFEKNIPSHTDNMRILINF